MVKFRRVAFGLCEETDRQTNKQSYSSQTSHPSQGDVITFVHKTRKLCYRKDDRTMHLMYEFPESF